MTGAWANTTPTERLFLDEVVPHNPVIITASITLSKCPSEQWIFSNLIPRVLAHPRFSARIIVPPNGKAKFETIPGFATHSEQLKQHHVVIEPVIDVSLPHDKRANAFQQRLSQIISEPFPQHRPLWKMFFFPMWSIAPESQAKQCATIVFRVHHAIGDGVGLVEFFLSHIIDKDEENIEHLCVIPRRHRHARQPDVASAAPRSDIRGSRGGWLANTKHALIEKWMAFTTNVYAVVGTMVPEEDNTFVRSGIQAKKVCALMPPSAAYTVASLKSAARSLGITINDMLYTAVSGATRAYLTESGDDVDGLKDLRCGVPYNQRLDTAGGGELSNQFAIMSLPLHACQSQLHERLRLCVRTMRIMKRGTAAVLMAFLLKMVARLPTVMRRSLWRRLTRCGSLVFTNVPGPRRAVSVGGMEVSGLHFFAPCDGHCGVVVGLHSYNGRISIGVYGDEQRIRNPQRYMELLDEEIKKLLQLGDVRLISSC